MRIRPDGRPPKGSCRCRRADPGDGDYLESVLQRAWGQDSLTLFDAPAHDVIASSTQEVYLGFRGDEAVACIFASVGEATILHGLAVVPEHRGRGYARSLIGDVMANIKSREAPESYWTAVDPDDPSLEDRFRSLGFTTFGPLRGLTLLYHLENGD